MTLEQAMEHVSQGVARRTKAARERYEEETAARLAAAQKEEKAKHDFVAEWFSRMVAHLDKAIENAAMEGRPSADCSIPLIERNMVEPNGEHEIALLDALKAHYETAGFTVRWWHPNQDRWGSIQVSGWMESPCG